MVKSYVVSGANRGVGLGLIRSLLDESDSVVYAGVRDPSAQGELSKLASSHDGRVHIVKLAAGSKEDAAALNAKIKEEVGHLDVLIANAGEYLMQATLPPPSFCWTERKGISDYYGPLATSPIEQFHRHFDVNLIGPVVLYQELQSSLLAAAQPKFIAISTAGASIGTPFPLPATPYLASKAALNLVVQHIALEEPTFVAIAISPGES